MAGEKTLGTVKRFGARYGRRVRHKVAQIEAIRFAKKKCPYCHAWRVKRIAAGIWNCTKCKSKFAGKAYNIAEKIIIKEEVVHAQEADMAPHRSRKNVENEEEAKDLNN